MPRINRLILVGGMVALVSGCSQPPLLFSSATSFGVSIMVSSASTNPIDLSLGYKQLDASLVPVTYATTTGADAYHPIRGCYAAVGHASGSAGCTTQDGTTANIPAKADVADPPQHDSPKNSGGGVIFQPFGLVLAGGNSRTPGKAPGSLQPNAIATAPTGMAGSSLENRVVAHESESMRDSLSVFSSFNGAARGSPSSGASVGLGEVFATGVAAQQLTEGQNYYLQKKGASLSLIAACVGDITTALGQKTTLDELKICNPTGSGS